MEAILFKLLAFIVAIGVLVSVHEFGHFWVARKLGIRVLRFSIGFGKPLWRRVGKVDDIEYVIAAIPLGGYVKMLDEREGDVPPELAHRAFNRQSLAVRSAVVVAGPLFNFIFAILAFWAVLMLGETGLRSTVGEVAQGTPAFQAGILAGDQIISVNDDETPTWGLVVQALATSAVSDQPIRLALARASEQVEAVIPAGALGDPAENPNLLKGVGLTPARMQVPVVLGTLIPGEPAEQAGLLPGDRVLSMNDEPVVHWGEWVKFVQAHPGKPVRLRVERNGQPLNLTVIPRAEKRGDRTIGYIGAGSQVDAHLRDQYYVNYQLPVGAALATAIGRTGEYSWLTLKVMWRIVTLQASVKNLSGPLTIADAAGKTASYGLVYFLKFLAIVSISLGVLNLLPVPVLDGGHLLYFAVEAVRGRPVSEEAMLQGQKIGLILLAGLMSVAFYVDFTRFLG